MNSVPHFIDTDMGQLHVVERGIGTETIVLWPSIFTDHRIYDGLVGLMENQYRFLLIDGPGHGQSEGPVETFNMETCARAMIAVFDHFALERSIVGGTSWGGMTAAHVALMFPERVKALILMNTPMEIDGARPGMSARFIAMGARWMLSTRTFRNGVAKSFFTPEVLMHNPSYALAFHAMLKDAKPRPLAAAIKSVILRGSPLKGKMADIPVPTLVIAGKQDEMYPIAVQAQAALLAPHGQFEPVDGKHISPVEQPEKVTAILENFLSREVTQ
jgi:pimeloyl-ACP methyl ester carboxylesterase